MNYLKVSVETAQEANHPVKEINTARNHQLAFPALMKNMQQQKSPEGKESPKVPAVLVKAVQANQVQEDRGLLEKVHHQEGTIPDQEDRGPDREDQLVEDQDHLNIQKDVIVLEEPALDVTVLEGKESPKVPAVLVKAAQANQVQEDRGLREKVHHQEGTVPDQEDRGPDRENQLVDFHIDDSGIKVHLVVLLNHPSSTSPMPNGKSKWSN